MNNIQYLKLEAGGSFWEKAPKKLILYNDMIKSISQWESLGFKVKRESEDSFQYKQFKSGTYWYSFREYFAHEINNDPKLLEAITNKVKFIRYPKDIYLNRKLGITYNQIIELEKHLKFYAESYLLYDQKRFNESFDLIKKALSSKPDDVNYKTLYFDIKFQLQDLSAIEEILEYFQNDIDSYIHSGHLIDWIRLLAKSKDYYKTNYVIENVNKLLDDLIDGKRKNMFYGQQNRGWYINIKDEFNRKLYKLKGRIIKHV